MAKKQVANDLKNSGLFEKLAEDKFGSAIHSGGPCVYQGGKGLEYYLLTADEAEAVLDEMKVQVAKQDGWFLGSSELGGSIPGDLSPDYDEADPFAGIGMDQRTLANNAILAWFTKHEGWKTKLKWALGRLGQL